MMLYYRNLAIVGFNGTARGDCGYAVAIARHNQTGKYIRLSFPEAELDLAEASRVPGEDMPLALETYTPKGHLSVNDESAIKAFRDEELLTLFREGMEFPAFHNAMVLHVAQPLLDSAGMGLQSTKLEKLDWKLLSEVPHKVWVTCATVDSVFLLMDGWGQALMDKCIDHLIGYIASGEKDKNLLAKAEHSVESALYAARDDVLREVLFLLYGVTVTLSAPQRVGDVFELDFLPEFGRKKLPEFDEKEWTWPAFNQQLNYLLGTLNTRAKAKYPVVGGTKEGEVISPAARSLVNRILTHPPSSPVLEVLMDWVDDAARDIKREASQREKLLKAVEAAESCRRSFPPDEAAAREIINELKRDKFRINIRTEARLRVLASDPVFYLLPDAVLVKARGELNFWEYINWASEHGGEYQRVCGQTPLASYVLKQVEEILVEICAGAGRR